MKKTLLLTAGLALIIGGCAEMETQPAATAKSSPVVSPELDATIANAEKEIAAAKKVSNLWLHTEKFLTEAKEAKAAGKADEAMKKAKKALKEAQLAQTQAAAETGKVHFPK